MSFSESFRLLLTPTIKMQIVEDATLATAQTLHNQGFWVEAASHFRTVFDRTHDPVTLIQSYSGLAQQLVNYGAYGQALTVLEKGRQKIDIIGDERLRTVGLAVYEEKRGWIDDNLCNPNKAITHFIHAKRLLQGIRKITDKKEDAIDKLASQIESTSEHFAGRNETEKAKTSPNPIDDLNRSVAKFESDLNHHINLADSADYNPANIAFQYSHLALAHFRLADAYKKRGNFDNENRQRELAKDSIALAEHFFQEYTDKHPESAIPAHTEMTLGMGDLEMGSINRARGHFLKALGIRGNGLKTGKEPYTKGYVDASLAVALTDYSLAISSLRNKSLRDCLGVKRFLSTLYYGGSALYTNFGYAISRIMAGSP